MYYTGRGLSPLLVPATCPHSVCRPLCLKACYLPFITSHQVVILSRITPHQYKKLQIPNKNAPLPDVNPDPLTSNVYSVGERILLAWINHHYNMQRKISWPEAIGGEKYTIYLPFRCTFSRTHNAPGNCEDIKWNLAWRTVG